MLDSLREQRDQVGSSLCDSMELIVVDQNGDDRLVEILGRPWPFAVVHIRTPGERGASRARNHGAKIARGRYVIFPDDDCWYPPDFLSRGTAIMISRRLGFLSGRPANEFGRSINGRFKAKSTPVNASNIWTTQIEWTTMFDRAKFIEVGGYDADIGVGAATPWQSGEGQELTFRLLKAGSTGHYDPAWVAHHEELNVVDPDETMIIKGRNYARGMGRVLRMTDCRPAVFYGWWLTRPLVGSILAQVRGKKTRARYFRAVASGRFEGWLGRISAAATR